MGRSLQTPDDETVSVNISGTLPRQMRVDLERLARRHDRSFSAELRRAVGLYVRAAKKREGVH
jgi:hypothetical protein